MTLRSKHILSLLVFLLSFLSLLSADAAWSSESLDSPLAVGGIINRVSENGEFSFQLNPDGIPEESLKLVVTLRDDYSYDSDEIAFNEGAYSFSVGSPIQGIMPGTHAYTNNGQISEGEGANVDLIEGGSADISVTYQPLNTHQTGCLWWAPHDPSFTSFEAKGGLDYCHIDGKETTFVIGDDGNLKVHSVTIRALSVFDPWFDEMEELYDSGKGNGDGRIDNWKDRYLSLTDSEHKAGVNEALGEDHPLYRNDMWRYPAEDTEFKYYADFQVTVRSPLEKLIFTAMSQTAVVNGAGQKTGDYVFLDDQRLHPDMSNEGIIWCWDTSNTEEDGYSVDAYYIQVEMVPDYKYHLRYEIVEGAAVGTISTEGIDSTSNDFRFIPSNTTNENRNDYGAVTIKVTAEDIDFSTYVTLYYMPNEGMMVKYIGEKGDEDHPGESVDDDLSTVPEEWKKGAVLKTGERGVIMADGEESGEWDLLKTADGMVSGILPLQTLVLDRGETFPLAAVAYVRPSSGTSSYAPYYMTSGYPVANSGTAEPSQASWIEYAVSFTVYNTADTVNANIVSDAVAFDSYASRVKDGEYTRLSESAERTGTSWWYTEDCIDIRAEKEGLYYLEYIIAPVTDGKTDEIVLETGYKGGIYLYIIDPVDQVLTAYLKGCGVQGSGSYKTNYAIPIDRYISIGQMDKWYLGGHGVTEHVYNDKGLVSYMGRALASFSSEIELKSGWFTDLAGQKSTDVDTLSIGEGTGWRDESFEIGYTVLNASSYLDISEDSPGFDYIQPSMCFKSSPLEISRAKAGLSDIDIFSADGLMRFSVRGLRIDDGTANTGTSVTEKSLKAVNNKKVLDFSSLASLEYLSFNSSGAGISAAMVDEMRFPPSIIALSFSDDDTSCLDCTLVFQREGSGSTSLKCIDLSSASFSDIILEDLDKLEHVVSGAGIIGTGGGRRLTVRDCPSLEWVDANGTSFNELYIHFPKDTSMNATLMKSYTGAWKALMRANHSKNLESVFVSGGLTYLELIDDPALKDLTQSTDENTFRKGDVSSGSYVKTVNLGGTDNIIETFMRSGIDSGAFGDSLAEYTGFSAFSSPRSWVATSAHKSDGLLIDSGSGSNAISELRLANVGQLYSQRSSGHSKSLRSADIGTIFGAASRSIFNMMLGLSQTFSLRNCVNLESLNIDRTYYGAFIDFSQIGRNVSKILDVNVKMHGGSLLISNGGHLDNLKVNAELASLSGCEMSNVSLSGSLISNLHSGNGDSSSVEVYVNTFTIYSTEDLESVILGSAYGNGKTADSTNITFYDNPDLKDFEIYSGRVNSIEVYTCALENLNIQSCSNLTELDVHDNNLGDGYLRVGGFEYSDGKFLNMVDDIVDWMNGNSLESFIAYGNEIGCQYSSNGSSWMERSGKFMVGTIPEDKSDVVIADVNLTIGYNGYSSCEANYYLGDLHYSAGERSNNMFDTNENAHIKRTDSYEALNKDGKYPSGTVFTARYTLRGNDNDVMSYMTIYPFGK